MVRAPLPMYGSGTAAYVNLVRPFLPVFLSFNPESVSLIAFVRKCFNREKWSLRWECEKKRSNENDG